MTLKDVQKLPVLQTKAVARTAGDSETRNYVIDCLLDFFGGYYGTVPEEDTEKNNQELARGEGRIVARYPRKGELERDLFLIAEFSESYPGADGNHVTMMYADDR